VIKWIINAQNQKRRPAVFSSFSFESIFLSSFLFFIFVFYYRSCCPAGGNVPVPDFIHTQKLQNRRQLVHKSFIIHYSSETIPPKNSKTDDSWYTTSHHLLFISSETIPSKNSKTDDSSNTHSFIIQDKKTTAHAQSGARIAQLGF